MNGCDELEWLIEDYKKGETPTFIEHIKAGVKVLSEDDRAVLVFSGGPTRPETPLSEAQSYANLSSANDHFNLLPASPSPSRILVESKALDSYYNILFSLVLFWRHHSLWPEHLTIVSHAFKRYRLVEGHCAAIGFPLERVAFVGINPPGIGGDGGVIGKEGEKGEVMKGVGKAADDWERDPMGEGDMLAGKRRGRNPWRIEQGLFSEEERVMAGVGTRILGDGTEVLVKGGRRTWA